MPYTLFNGDVKYSISYLSSVKGMLRTASIFGFRTLFREEGYSCEELFGKTCPELSDEERKKLRFYPCPICRTYGMTGLRGCKIIVTNIKEVMGGIKEMKYRFLYRGPYDLKVSKEPLKVSVICDKTFKCNVFIILLGLYYINKGIIRLGGFKSRGLGIFRVEIEGNEWKKLIDDVNVLRGHLEKCLGEQK
jgi:CRISPR/Cas system CSM-associated protein Csm3 (group 7 of RAMP superfamily)